MQSFLLYRTLVFYIRFCEAREILSAVNSFVRIALTGHQFICLLLLSLLLLQLVCIKDREHQSTGAFGNPVVGLLGNNNFSLCTLFFWFPNAVNSRLGFNLDFWVALSHFNHLGLGRIQSSRAEGIFGITVGQISSADRIKFRRWRSLRNQLLNRGRGLHSCLEPFDIFSDIVSYIR